MTNSDPGLASQAASLRAGVAAVVMIVVICFGVALTFSDRSPSPVGASEDRPAAADPLNTER